VLVAVQATAYAISAPTRQSIIPRLIGPGDLAAANTLNSTMFNAAMVAGPLCAGVLMIKAGVAAAYVVDASAFTVALWATFVLPAMPPALARARGVGRRIAGWREVREGLTYIVRSPVLLLSFAIDIAAMVLAMPRSLFPEIAQERFGEGSIGWLYAAIAIGSVVAGGKFRLDRAGNAGKAWPSSSRCSAGGVAVALAGLAGSLWLAGGAAGRGRRRRPGQRGLPANDLADVRAGRVPGPHAGNLHSRLSRADLGSVICVPARRRPSPALPCHGWAVASRRPWWQRFSPCHFGTAPLHATYSDQLGSRDSTGALGRCTPGTGGGGMTGGGMGAVPSGTQWTITSGDHEAVIVEVGGGLRAYRVGDTEVVDGYAEDEISPASHGQVLAPWPNRIRDGRYTFGGESYQLFLTEPARHNAIHGLVNWVRWHQVGAAAADSVTVEYDLPPQPGYPWALSLRTTWTVGPDGLRADHRVINQSDTGCPFGLSVHPYLVVPGGCGGRTVRPRSGPQPVARRWPAVADRRCPGGRQRVRLHRAPQTG